MKPYDELTFTDDFMFSKILYTNPDLCEELLELILGKHVTILESPAAQKSMQIRYDSHGIRLDVYVEDSDKSVYDIEMQVQSDKNLPLRSRYYHAMLDIDQLERGSTYDGLKETFVIFICKDSIGKEFTDVIYSYRMKCLDHPDLPFNDKASTLILNTSGDITPLSSEMQELLQYIQAGTVTGDKENFVHRIEQAVQKARTHQEWRSEYMTFEMKLQEYYAEGREEGRQEGREEGRQEERQQLWQRLVEKYGEEEALTIMPNPNNNN